MKNWVAEGIASDVNDFPAGLVFAGVPEEKRKVYLRDRQWLHVHLKSSIYTFQTHKPTTPLGNEGDIE